MRVDTKLCVLIRDDLAAWQALNVCAFLVSGIAAAHPDLIGDPYADADGVRYLPMLGHPVLVMVGGKETLTAAHARALARDLPVPIFTADLFDTHNDADNRAAVRAVPTAHLDLVGMAVYAPRNAADKITKGARLHP